MSNTRCGWVARLFVLVAVCGVCGRTLSAAEPAELKDLASRAVSEDSAAAKEAVAKLREAGPDGLAVMLASYGDVVRAGGGGKDHG